MTRTDTTATRDKRSASESLVGPTDPALDRAMRDEIITARVSLLIASPFFGNLATRLKLVNADEWCSTAATDGRNLYYNSRFIKKLRPREIVFLLAHEILHCCYDHFGRRGDRDHRLWNIANDYCVNADLKRHNIGEFITTVPALYDAKYDGMSSEEVYDDLYENAEKINLNDLIDQLLDEHMDGDGDGDGGGDTSGAGDNEGGGRPQLSEEERQQIRDEMKEAMIAAARAAGAGGVPGGVKRIIGSLTEPKMNWRELLRQQLQSTVKSDYSWMRPSRRSWHCDSVLPGTKNDEMINIALAIDTSGSISGDMLRDFLNEVSGITEQFPAYHIHLFCFDTAVHNPRVYDADNLDDISEYDLAGGGGTDFTCVFDYLKSEEIVPERLVMLTDGYPWGSWGDENYCDTLFIIHGSQSIVAPYGVTAYYEESK